MESRGYGKVVLTLNHVSLSSEMISNPPSLQHGLTLEEEKSLRWLGCELIQKCCILLKLPTSAAATAQSLFHRYFYRKSFISKVPWKNVALASVILASRIEEEPRRFRDIINVESALRQFEDNQELKPTILDKYYVSFKQELIETERKILKELGFAVFSQFPHKIIILYLQTLMLVENAEIVQSSWNFMNDCQRTDILVRFSPEEVAMACIELASRQFNYELPGMSFFKIIRVDPANVEKVAAEIVSMYNTELSDRRYLALKVAQLREKMMAESKEVEFVKEVPSGRVSVSAEDSRRHSGRRSMEKPHMRSKYKENERRDQRDRRDLERRDNRRHERRR